MSKIERGQFADLLRRYLGMTGSSEVAGELAPEISPVLALETDRPEWEFLKGAKLMSVGNAQAAGGAGTFAGFKFRNPSASGVVAVFSHISVTSPAASVVFVGAGNESANLGNVIGSTPRDTRFGIGAVTAVSAIIVSRDNTNPGGFIWGQAVINGNIWSPEAPYVLTPGFELTIGTTTENVRIEVTAHWLEKRIDQLER